MNLELVRLNGKIRGFAIRGRARIFVASVVAMRHNEPESIHLCDLCGIPATMFCRAHTKLLCDGCVSAHQEHVKLARIEDDYFDTILPIARCCAYVSMRVYRQVSAPERSAG